MGAGGGARLKVTIVGAGNMGRGIGRRIVAGGNEVELVDRNPEDSRTLAGDLGGLAASSRRVTGDVVVLALPYEEVPKVVAEHQEGIAGGMLAVDVGPLRRARMLEQVGLFHIASQEQLGTGFASALSLRWDPS